MTRLPSFKLHDFFVPLGVAGAIILAFATLGPAMASVRDNGLNALRNGRLDITPQAGTSIRSEHGQTVDGQPWSLTAFTNSQNQVCAGQLVPNDAGDGGQALTCRDPQTMFANTPLVAFSGARATHATIGKGWTNSWVFGWASPAVASVNLRLTNCSVIQLPLSADHTFLQVFSRGQLASGVAAQTLTALDSAGRTIGSQDVVVAPPVNAHGQSQGSAPSRASC
jgi:hypothetical protein